MVDGGFWTWRHPDPGLPGVDGVPLTNLAGWMLAGTVLIAVVDRILPCPVSASDPASTTRTTPAAPPTPAVLLAWTWLGSTLANLTFFDRPMLAGYGFLALGATVAPYLLLVVRDARRDGVRRGTGRTPR
jgi:putative membrane protein